MTEDKILWTAKYVEGDLTDLEKLEFENLLAHDEELQQHLADYKDIHSSLKAKLADDSERKVLVETLKGFDKEFFVAEQHVPKVRKLNTYMRWVSGIAAVLVLGILIWAPWKGDLYQQYGATPQMSVTERGAEATDLDKAASLFNAKNYVEAKIILASLYEADKSNSLVNYYYALTLLETNEIAKGRLMLVDISEGESAFKNDATYDLAMSYLKDGSNTDAKFWLSKIPDGATHYDKAQELLRKLK